MKMSKIIENKLVKAIKPDFIEVIDESSKHIGHAGAKPEGETHFNITIISTIFEGMSRIKCHQMIYKILKDEMNSSIHALAIKTTSSSKGE